MLELAQPSPDHEVQTSKQLSIWRNRAFLMVFSSYSFNLLGSTFHSIALNLWVLQTTGSAKLMSLVLITHLVASMLLGPIAGTLADRVDRRRLMLICDWIRFGLVGLIALCMTIESLPFFIILTLTALVAIVSTLRSPAFQASLVEIVGKESVAPAVAAITISDNMIRIGGFAVGGIAVALFGGAFAVAIDASTFLLSAILLMFAGHFPYQAAKRQALEVKSTFRSDFVEGFRAVWHNAFIRSVILLLPLVMFFFLSTFMLIQVMAVQVWKASPFVFGLLEACIPLGYVVGSFFIMKWDNRIKKRGLWILGSILLLGPCFIAIAQFDSAAWALPVILLVGFLFSFSSTIISIALRMNVETDLQGRVFGLLGTLTSVAPPIGLAVFSALSDKFGPALIITYSGAAMLLISLAAFHFMKNTRRLE